MWSTEWGRAPVGEFSASFAGSRLAVDDVDAAQALLWEEHCIECAIPDCYAVCPLYVRRGDGRCARFHYGIHANEDFSGLYPFGADVRFRRWGKLEAKLPAGVAAPTRLRQMASLDRTALAVLEPIVSALDTIDPKRRLKGERKLHTALGLARETVVSAAARSVSGHRGFDDFVIEATNPEAEAVNLIVEVDSRQPLFRESLRLEPGANFYTIPASGMLGPFADAERPRRILVYPENDAEVRLIFTWLDFVSYRDGRASGSIDGMSLGVGPSDEPSAAADALQPSSKVKCVAWDLDNTIWTGVLVEDGPAGIALREEVSDVIRELDRRGILNTIVSKNDMQEAWRLVETLGLAEYFVAPQINWDPKSANLRRIADRLDIGLDTFALIDDSPFERAEVTSELPHVRTYSEDTKGLLALPEFDVLVTDDTPLRRLSYLAEDTRKAHAEAAGGNYIEFLRACDIEVEVFEPTDEHERKRLLELIQRSNQLNLSTQRYSNEEFDALLRNRRRASFAWRCRDRFGDYGIVGFASISVDPRTPTIRDLVISCRVAKKKVENGLVHWLAGALRQRGFSSLGAEYVPTARNHVLLDALQDAGFGSREAGGNGRQLVISVDRPVPHGDVVTVLGIELPSDLRPTPAGPLSRANVDEPDG